ncbi:YCF48-related protein [Soonwooa sp.]|uniref:T9SS type A sorting domain-containing protein n=1 Tax=Soonwooa sp. TaxID=1938592 RepID=UPI0028B170E5|nr:T9SS type A sorting domain-containing protein [Soonwooa sp.]
MKTFFTFFLFIFTFPCFAQWIEVDHGIEVTSFNDVYAINSNIALVIGDRGTIAKTIDGGETWQIKPSGTTNKLVKLKFVTANIGYILGSVNTLLKTIDGGESWSNIYSGPEANFIDVSCVNEDVIFITTDNGLIKSTDGGNNWSNPISIPYKDKVQFINNNIGFVSRYSDHEIYWELGNNMAKTSDGGLTWREINAVSPFCFLNENIGFSYSNGLYKTINGGNTFDIVYNSYPKLSDMFVLNNNMIWGIFYWETLDYATPIRGILKTSDTGENSNYMFPHTHDFLFKKIHFANENTGYIVGSKRNGNLNKGLIWKNNNGLNESLEAQELKDIKFKIYPNPSTTEVNILLAKRLNEDFSVTIFDMSGRQVYFQEFANVQNINIKTNKYRKGKYILSLKTEQKTINQKIITH